MKALKHIVYIEAGYPHPHGGGGAGTYVQLVGRELVRRGYQVSVLAGHCTSCPAEYLDQGVKVYRPSFKVPIHWYISKTPLIKNAALAARSIEFGWKTFTFLKKIHKQHPIDLVEFSEGGDFFHTIRKKFPVVSHLHGSLYTFKKQAGNPISRNDRLDRKINLANIQKADWVVAPSQAILSIVEEEAGKPFKHSSVIPYPLDPALLDESETPVEKPLGIKVVLFAARNDPVKGADVLMKAIPLITSQLPDVNFWFFGYQPENEEEVHENVRIFPFLPKIELFRYYRAADVVVVPSIWDNSPNTVYEAMAAGKALVASRVGGVPELVMEGVTGSLVEPGNDHELAESIIYLLRDDQKRIGMGIRARENILKISSLTANIDARLILYNQSIQKFKDNS